jgi:hypothetical protein
MFLEALLVFGMLFIFIGIPLAGIYSTPEKKNDIFLID